MQETLTTVWHQMRVPDVLDVAIVAVLIYGALHWLRQRTTRSVAVVLMGMTAIYVLAHEMEMYLTMAAFRLAGFAVLVALVVVYQDDIRRGVERLSTWRVGHRRQALTRPEIDTLVEAVRILATEKIGALIILPGRRPIEPHLRGGVVVEGQISIPLLHSIFHHASMGHDGAVIIDRGRIERLGVHLPLTRNLQTVGRGGTRHAAAVGLSERCDALAIVVSEERGTISIAEQGELRAIDSASALQSTLERFYGERNGSSTERRSWGTLVQNLMWKAVAVVLATGLWFLLALERETVQRAIADVPVEFRNLPLHHVLQDVYPEKVTVTLSGSDRAFSLLDPAKLKAVIDLENVERGGDRIELTERHFSLPRGLSVMKLEPETVQVSFERLVPKQLPIEVAVENEELLRHGGWQVDVDPATVNVLIPESMLKTVSSIKTEAIKQAAWTPGASLQVKLVVPAGVQPQESLPGQVRVTFRKQQPSPQN
ncbi:MAG: adenylate cyclase [Pirellulaceae bacterium]|nr:MAG: adenylate cyclase [Pirellulaceae bacterium]